MPIKSARLFYHGFFLNTIIASVLAGLPPAVAAADDILDCPLRDTPFSVDMPMMDLAASPEAKAVLDASVPELMQRIPAMFLATEAPALSAIMTLRGSTELLRMPMSDEAIAALNGKLGTLAITEEIKRTRCARYDNELPEFALSDASVQVLVFKKVNGYDHEDGGAAAAAAIQAMSEKNGWGVTITDRAGAFNAKSLSKFDVVVWNNVSGDVLTLSQREAFRDFVEQGGGFLGIHGSGGDFMYLWDWYLESLIGAQFIGHTMAPHYQDATVRTAVAASGISQGIDAEWTVHDEWYSFAENPRKGGADVVLTVDENSYKAEMSGISLRMGEDHPIAWSRCVGAGRAFYTAIGHLPGVYDNAQNLALLENALAWAAGEGLASCGAE